MTSDVMRGVGGRGRVEFGNIYGFGLTGSIWIWFMINLMSQKGQYVELYTCLSVLGYSFAPFVLLAYTGIFFDLKNPIGYSVCALFVAWSTTAGAKLFEKNMSM